MAQSITHAFAKVKSGGVVIPPPTGTTLADVTNMMYRAPLTGSGFGTHQAPLEINNTGAAWRTHSFFGPVPFLSNNPGFVGNTFICHNVWWQCSRAVGFTDPAILQCSVEMECPKVWQQKNNTDWTVEMTNPSSGTPKPIDGTAATLGTPNGGYYKTTDVGGANNFAQVTQLTTTTRVSFAAGSDVDGAYGDGHRTKLAGIVTPTGGVPPDGQADILHMFYPGAYSRRVMWPQNNDSSAANVMIFSRARLVGPVGLDLRKVAVQLQLCGDLFEGVTVGSFPGGVNPPVAQSCARWLVDPGGSLVTVRGPWVPMGGLYQAGKTEISTINAAHPIPCIGL